MKLSDRYGAILNSGFYSKVSYFLQIVERVEKFCFETLTK